MSNDRRKGKIWKRSRVAYVVGVKPTPINIFYYFCFCLLKNTPTTIFLFLLFFSTHPLLSFSYASLSPFTTAPLSSFLPLSPSQTLLLLGPLPPLPMSPSLLSLSLWRRIRSSDLEESGGFAVVTQITN
jgi:hypothetical protein